MAAGGVLALALIPIVMAWVFFWTHPEAAQFASQERIFEGSAVNLLLMLIAAGLSVYGTHALNTLRQEVFEARRLNTPALPPVILPPQPQMSWSQQPFDR